MCKYHKVDGTNFSSAGARSKKPRPNVANAYSQKQFAGHKMIGSQRLLALTFAAEIDRVVSSCLSMNLRATKSKTW